MEFNDQPVTTPARAAATVLLLRDADQGMEVFMVKRHGLSDVLGGACVFPGGKVDPADATPNTLERLNTPLERLHTALGEPQLDAASAAGLFVAACRETFEEAGVLLAESATARHVDVAQTHVREGLSFSDVLARLELRLDCGNIVPWMRWVTPRVPMMLNKRFDARFFLAAVPHDQQPQHDNHEATEGFWLRPRVALERYWMGEINLAPAQIMSLAALSHLPNVAGALAAAKTRRPLAVQPEVFVHDHARAVAFPGDARHPVVERALPGPTCLVFRNERFEPVDGFEALFA